MSVHVTRDKWGGVSWYPQQRHAYVHLYRCKSSWNVLNITCYAHDVGVNIYHRLISSIKPRSVDNCDGMTSTCKKSSMWFRCCTIRDVMTTRTNQSYNPCHSYLIVFPQALTFALIAVSLTFRYTSWEQDHESTAKNIILWWRHLAWDT